MKTLHRTAVAAALLAMGLPAAASDTTGQYIREISLRGNVALIDLSFGDEPAGKPACASSKYEYRTADAQMIAALKVAAQERLYVEFKGSGTCTGTSENLDSAVVYFGTVI